MLILSLNCGSSSVKYLLYDWDDKEVRAKGIVERVTIGGSFITQEVPGRDSLRLSHECPNHKEAIKLIMDILTNSEGVIEDLREIKVVSHRVVHGGEKFTKSVLIDGEVLNIIKEVASLAPLHNPPNIAGIEAAKSLLPNIPQVAVFDTAWHQTMPAYAYIYALPYEWYEEYGIRRYGFHGTSLLYVAKRAAVLLGKDPFQCNLISCHIGNGVSINAVRDGLSVDTSMGFTPVEGAVMGTRAGDHDAAADLSMIRKKGYTIEEMDNILNKKSGILGITGKYSDRRDVLKAAKDGEERAKLAIEIETYRLKKYIGAYAAILGRVDALIFTAGVGEMSSPIRARVLEGLEPLGIKYNREKNKLARTRNAELDISAENSRVKIFVIPTDEEIIFVEDAVAILEGRYNVHTKFRYSFEDPGYRNKMRDEEFARECEKNPALTQLVAKIPFPYPNPQ
ncbi:MAG: acetate kinase [Candidatus Aerophobetes bacterium]|nr:acetate kinase [Candidatus Aerophobetes bacterium]